VLPKLVADDAAKNSGPNGDLAKGKNWFLQHLSLSGKNKC
jgi:hypothetical protein